MVLKELVESAICDLFFADLPGVGRDGFCIVGELGVIEGLGAEGEGGVLGDREEVTSAPSRVLVAEVRVIEGHLN